MSDAVRRTVFRVVRDDLARAETIAEPVAPGPDEALLRIDRFALTANNVTYAAHGADMRYWDFFPVAPPWGVIPVWGFASVVASEVHGVAVGERLYGYWPMASHAVVTPGKVTVRGFVDTAAHRADLAKVYNGYQRTTGDPHIGDERVYALFRPLFLTSFLLADVLIAGPPAHFVLSSASSKTALGLAQVLSAHGHAVTGLTAERNRGFVARTGYYAQVATYAEVATLPAAGPTVFVDFSGDGALRLAVHTQFGDRLIQSIAVGDTHWEAAGRVAVPGPRPEAFFAPAHLATRLGDPAYVGRQAAAWTSFLASTTAWLRIVEAHGAGEVTAHYAALLAGRIDPADGLICSL